MRQYFSFALAVLSLAVILGSCGDADADKCVIEGTVNPRFEGKKIFLVPLNGPQDAAHVDSVVIKDGKFRFVKDTTQLEVIRVDYHFRTGVQDLLVVTEPGRLKVVIDSISDSQGTPQNDSLSKWKAMSASFNAERAQRTQIIKEAKRRGDTITVNRMKAEIDSCQRLHKQHTRRLAENMKEGVLHDFLESVFPRTYKKRLPDGSIVTVNND